MIASGRKGLYADWVSVLSQDAGIELEGEPVMDVTRLATCLEHHPPRVLLLDKALLGSLDPQLLRKIRAQSHRVRVLLLWDEVCRSLVTDVVRNRFNGFLLTTCRPDVCLKAIRAVDKGELWLPRSSLAMAVAELQGRSEPGDVGASGDGSRVDVSEALTPREMQVVASLRRGCINKEIAQELGIMEDTVKKHLQSVFAKLGVRRRALVAMRQLPG
jgi:DNA-binding NarL/FixJ family response regulator